MTPFSFPEFLLAIASAAALLVWSVRLVRTGFERAFGPELRAGLRKSTSNRVYAALTGAVAAFLLQSATGVSVLVAGFMSSSAIAPLPAFAMLLGADVGSALVAQVLVVQSSVLVSVLLLTGCVLFLRSKRPKLRQCGRILIGISLILISLSMISMASAPLVEIEAAQVVFGYLGRDLVTAFVLAAVLAWLMHSSLAAVLLWVTFAAQGVLPVEAAMAMVLGANLGGAFIAFALTLAASVDIRRMVLANLLWRGGFAALGLIPLTYFPAAFTWLGATDAQQVLNLHLAFNLALLVIGLPVSSLMIALASALVADADPDASDAANTTLLDPSAQSTPNLALGLAARELMHIAERVAVTLGRAMQLYRSYDMTAAATTRRDYQAIRTSVRTLKFYLTRLDQSKMTDQAIQKSHDLVESAIHIGTAAEAISEKMVRLAEQIHTEHLQFSQDGMADLEDMFDLVLQNVQLGINVLMTQDPSAAASLVERKATVREAEKAFRRRHLDRLQQQTSETTGTSDVHLETLQVLKSVNASFAMMGYPLLEQTGAFLDSRLVK
uniref:Na/Pi cotransporter family protein n=2 Tax=Yoonia sp. TaxID=2212373 RepID=UPI0040477009